MDYKVDSVRPRGRSKKS